MANLTTDVTSLFPANSTTTAAMPVNATTAAFANATTVNSTMSAANTTSAAVNSTTAAPTVPAVDPGPGIVAAVLALIAMASLILNILVIIIFARVKPARKRWYFFALEMAIFDCIAVFLWTVLSLVATGGIDLGAACHMQTYVMSIVSLVAMHTLFVVNFERCVKLFRPSKHYEIFGGNRTVTYVIMITVFIYSFTVAIFPLLGFGKIAFFTNQYQCAWNFEMSLSHQNFLFLVGYVLPFIGSIVCQIVSVMRAKKISAQVQPGGVIILEENKDVPEMTYAEKLKKMENRFKYTPNKPKVRKNKRRKKPIDTSSSSDSERDDDRDRQREKRKRKRRYKFKHEDFNLAVTFIILTSVHFLCWLPYFIVGYVWIAPGYSTVGDGAFGFVVCLCHFSLVIKPIVYLTNARFRSYASEAFKKKKSEEEEEEEEKAREKHSKQTNSGDDYLKPRDDVSESKFGSRRSSVGSGSRSNVGQKDYTN